MEVDVTFRLVLYLLLLTGSSLFLYQTFQEYLQGSTFYSVSREPLTLHDLPTLTVCWKVLEWNHMGFQREYGKDFTIHVRVLEKEEKIVTLIEDQSVPTLFSLRIHLEQLWSKKKIGNPCFPGDDNEVSCIAQCSSQKCSFMFFHITPK